MLRAFYATGPWSFIFETRGKGFAKTEKKNHAQEKEDNKFVHKEAGEDFMEVPHIFGICIFLIFLVQFEKIVE